MRGMKMKHKNLDKQQQILDFVNKQVREKGYPPSVREICKAVGFKSTSTVHSYLAALEEQGLIVKDPSKTRALKVVDRKSKELEGYISDREIENVPIIGRVAAGQPILAVENIEDTFPVPVEYLENGPTFILRIKGDSMINAGIFDGDRIIVQKQSHAKNGDYVVALIDDEVTVKTFYKENGYFRLQPENDAMEPIIVSDLQILGVVIGLFRIIK